MLDPLNGSHFGSDAGCRLASLQAKENTARLKSSLVMRCANFIKITIMGS